MFAFPDPFVAVKRQFLESAHAIAMASFAGFEKLTELNVQAAKASVEESIQTSISLLETRDVKALTETFSAWAMPVGDKFAAYARHVHEIASETTAEIARVVEKQFSEGNRPLTDTIEALARNSPAGVDSVVTMARSAISAANETWNPVRKVNLQVVNMTEANVADAIGAEDADGKRITA